MEVWIGEKRDQKQRHKEVCVCVRERERARVCVRDREIKIKKDNIFFILMIRETKEKYLRRQRGKERMLEQTCHLTGLYPVGGLNIDAIT